MYASGGGTEAFGHLKARSLTAACAALALVAGCPSPDHPAAPEPPPNDPARAMPEGLPPTASPPASAAVEETSDEARFRRELEEARLRNVPPPSPCPAIAAEYARALAEARSCEPGSSSGCRATRMSLADTVESNRFCGCQVRVDPSRTVRLDEIMGRFNLAGCRLAVCSCPQDPGPSCRPMAAGRGGCL